MTDDAVNTAENSAKKAPGKPFVKGDPRINRKGRPVRGMDELKREWQDVWSEIMFDSNNLPIIDEVTGKKLTRLKARMRIATSSRNTQEFRTALEYAYGKPKEEIDLTSGGEPIQTKVDDERFDRAISSLADTLREIVSGKGAKPNGEMGPTK